jgi:RND family efflux transporter MFP subunit
MTVEQESDIERPVRAEKGASDRPSRRWLYAVLAFVLVAGVVISGILPRIQARNTVAKETKEMAIPTIVVVHPKPAAPSKEIILPANVQAYIDSPIYARTNGYLKKWYADIGARVTAGQLLAEIETPEVDQQLRQARADLNTSEANLSLAKITADRYAGLLKTDSVSKQDTDNAEANYAAQKATVRAMEANVNRLEQLQSFEKIYAPFTGVITARRTDIGALIDSGSSGGPQNELFHIVQPDRLRVYVNVPQVYSQAAKPGLSADLVLAEFPGRKFEGKLVRTADAIDQNTRTLLVEISVNNPTGTLFSGAYAEVHLKIPGATSSFTLPVTTLLFRSEGLRVVTVPDGQHAQLVPITVGRDYGSEIEVVAGVTGDDSVIANPPDSIVSGEEVRIAQPSSATPSSGGAKQ